MNDDWMEIMINIKKDRKTWIIVRKILLSDKLPPKTTLNFYKVIVMSVILYDSETWNFNSLMMNKLKNFTIESSEKY